MKLRIGLVLDDTLDTNDGVQQYVLTLGNWLAGRGHEVHYLAGASHERDLANLHSLSRNFHVSFNKNRLSIPLSASQAKLKKLLSRHEFDVLHVQMPYSPLMAGKLVKLAPPSTAIIGTFHVLPFDNLAKFGAKLLALYERRTLAKFDKVLAVSPAASDFASATFELACEVVPNVVPVRHFASAKPTFKNKDRKLTILFFGRLVPRKGCHILLEAVAELVASNQKLPDFQVIICGAGPLMPSLIKFVGDNGLKELVKFVGYVSESDKPARYASADIAVFPSSGGESFGIVLVEAMASGRAAVLAGDNPGYASVLGPGPDLLFDASDASGLAKKLAAYLSDASARRRAASWGEERAKDFDVNRLGLKIEAAYNQVLSSGQKMR